MGSSPRGRGKPLNFAGLDSSTRLIPAWAGKTKDGAGVTSTPRAHPRVGGENEKDVAPFDMKEGSSPRGRGKPRRVEPALQDALAHPRVGGENDALSRALDLGVGSSPRGRGKRVRPVLRRVVVGLIPAWAGKTMKRRKTSSLITAHPRVGGENAIFWARRVVTWGSSPRGRGKHVRQVRV